MAFPQSVKNQVMRRSGGRCECKRKSHEHSGRCNESGSEYHHVTSAEAGGPDTAKNCEFLCKPCHRGTRSYGNH